MIVSGINDTKNDLALVDGKKRGRLLQRELIIVIKMLIITNYVLITFYLAHNSMEPQLGTNSKFCKRI